MLQNLNFDCLESIFKLLNLEQQIKIFRTCPQFEEVVEGLWRRTYKSIDLSEDTPDMDFLCYADESIYLDFMAAISGTVEELQLQQRVQNQDVDWDSEDFEDQEWLQRLSCLSRLTFPNVKLLHLTLQGELSNAINFSKMFPALSRLELYCNRDFEYGEELEKSLETSTNCNMLEEIYINSELLTLIIDKVLRLRHLRKIVGIHSNGKVLNGHLLGEIASSSVGNRVHTLAINFVAEQSVQEPFKDVMKEVLNFPNMRNFFTLAGEEEYDSAFSDGALESALVDKSVRFGAYIDEYCNNKQMNHYYRKTEDTTTVPENTHYERYDFWNRKYAPQIDFYCKLKPAADLGY